jgi:hypothetical protein
MKNLLSASSGSSSSTCVVVTIGEELEERSTFSLAVEEETRKLPPTFD